MPPLREEINESLADLKAKIKNQLGDFVNTEITDVPDALREQIENIPDTLLESIRNIGLQLTDYPLVVQFAASVPSILHLLLNVMNAQEEDKDGEDSIIPLAANFAPDQLPRRRSLISKKLIKRAKK